ncbi:MAG: MauE/DoxX family redox-associated membrane protein [Patescibacteria group bacterium]
MHTWPQRVIIHLPRILVGSVLVITGLAKVLDMPGFAEVLSHYQLFNNLTIYTVIAYTLPFVELAIGFSLLLSWQTRWAALGAIALHLIFIIILTITLLRNIPISNCGCFGVFLARPLTWTTILEDVVMIAFSVSILMLPVRPPKYGGRPT